MAKTALDSLSLKGLTSRNPLMRRCLERAALVAATDMPVLIVGDTGTGKTLLARAIHNSSPRQGSGSFIAVNVSAISDSLVESELFGHEKGAFTGAIGQVRGRFELADRGTLFLDEIADMSIVNQAKVLRAVETGEFERLGSETSLRSDARMIAATHKPLGELVAAGLFREDLLHRLSGLVLRVPSLSERREDLPGLVASEVKSCAEAMKRKITAIHPEALAKLTTHSWPGNLRELHRVIQRALLFSEGEALMPDVIDFSDDIRIRPAVTPGAEAALTPGDDLSLAGAEKRHIQKVLALADSKTQAAKQLGISRTTLDRKIEEYHL